MGLRTRFLDEFIAAPRARRSRATRRRAAVRATVVDRRYNCGVLRARFLDKVIAEPRATECAGYPKARGGAGDGHRPPLALLKPFPEIRV
jgi:hypothetical protein